MDKVCPVARMAQCASTRLAFITEEESLSYGELSRRIAERQKVLAKAPEKIFPFFAPLTLDTLLTLLALFRLRKVALPLNPKLSEEGKERLKLPQECEEVATALFTSGTTGSPKLACHTLEQHLNHAKLAASHLKITSSSRYLLNLPLFHVSGIGALLRTLYAGGAIVVSSSPLSEALSHYQITHVSLVPTQLYRLLEKESHSYPHLACALIGGAPINQALYLRGRKAGLPLYLTYGMTETSSMATLASPETIEGELHVGTPLIALTLKEDGEIYVSGDTLFSGYLDLKTGKITPPQIPFPTRDLGRFLTDGSLQIIGRKDRMFISGGENIHPEELEALLIQMPYVRQARVLAVADDIFGHRPAAYLLSSQPYTLAQVCSFLTPHLPKWKLPIAAHLVSEDAWTLSK